ncbi:hypothetical protein R6Z07F_005535 [Ovis aries]
MQAFKTKSPFDLLSTELRPDSAFGSPRPPFPSIFPGVADFHFHLFHSACVGLQYSHSVELRYQQGTTCHIKSCPFPGEGPARALQCQPGWGVTASPLQAAGQRESMNYKLRNAGHRRPPAPGIDVREKRTCSERPGGHRVRSHKRTLRMHVRTLPAPSSTLAAPQWAVGSRKANGALCPRCWLRWVSLRVLLGKPPTPAPCPAPTSHNFSSQTPGKDGGLSKGFGWIAHLLWVLIGGDQRPDQVRRDDDAKPRKWTANKSLSCWPLCSQHLKHL